MSYTLTDEECAVLEDLRESGSASESRRAGIILHSASGAQTGAIAGTVGMSVSQVRHWRQAWREQRLGIFPSLSAPPADAAPEPGPVPGVDEPRLPLELRETPGMSALDAMAEAGRKALLFNFERMLLNEPGSRLGEDSEAVHDMRVATRRMRSAFRVFGPYFLKAATQPFRDELRVVAAALGEVRDLDVFIEKAQAWADANDADLTPLFEAWDLKRDEARARLIAYLDSKAFRQFVRRFDKFLKKPGKGVNPLPEPSAPVAYQVRHIVPGLIYERYERVRAYETTFEELTVPQLHALRIDVKRFRYAVEFFVEVLGKDARAVIDACKTMQDHLGDLHDAEVAMDALSAFVEAHKVEFSGIPKFIRPDVDGVNAYLAAKHDEKARLLATFAEAWRAFNSKGIRRSLALAVAAL